MKKLLCFLGIFVLLFLVALPPVLRILLPDYGYEKKEETKKEYSVLACSNDDFLVNTRYENDKVNMLVFIKNIVIKNLNDTAVSDSLDTEDNEIENPDINLENVNQEFNGLFDRLRNSGNVTYNKLEDRETISIDFSLSEQEDLNISSYIKPLNEQKAYYEALNLTCTIKR